MSEGFPYLANEILCAGPTLYGHEEWWDGYGDSRITWTYDPRRQEENADKLRFLFDSKNLDEVLTIRQCVREAHMSRMDNNWEHFLGVLVAEVEKHL